MSVLITIIIPSLNVADYIDECMRSVINQTLHDIEILCIDAGSDDGTFEILQEYAEKDSRIQVIKSDKKSYGYQVNLGIDKATGEYISIVESDDYISSDMMEKLYDVAKEQDHDCIRGNYTYIFEDRKEQDRILFTPGSRYYSETVDPNKEINLYREDNNIWKGIYKRSFLIDHNIRCNETKGAAYQDIGFVLQVLSHTNDIRYIPDAVYKYRANRMGASSTKKEALYFVYEEFKWLLEEKKIVKTKGICLRLCDCFLNECRSLLEKNGYDYDTELFMKPYKWLKNEVDNMVSKGTIGAADFDYKRWQELILLTGNLKEYVDKAIVMKSIVSELPTALYRWYPFREKSTFIYIGDEDAIFTMLIEDKHMDGCALSANEVFRTDESNNELADYAILSARALESCENPKGLFGRCKEKMKDSGIMLLAANNRLGMRYFCGDKDLYTNRCLDGVDDYLGTYGINNYEFVGRTYDASQIKDMLEACGLHAQNRYSVMPGLENPSMLIASDYKPNEKLASRIFPQYYSPSSVYIEEERLYDSFISNGLFWDMSNAFLFEVTKDGCKENSNVSDALQVTSSLDRGKENATITVIHRNNTVTKSAAYDEGKARICSLYSNMEKLKGHGLSVVEGRLEQDIYIMPFMDVETGQNYLENLLVTDKEEFLKKLDEFYEIIMSSSNHLEDDKETILEEAFIDLVPLNSFYNNGQFVFFDQEMCEHNLPAKYIMYRTIVILYGRVNPDKCLIDRSDIFKRYGISFEMWNDPQKENSFAHIDGKLMRELRNEDLLADYYRAVRRDSNVVNNNRLRMNYTADEYKRIFDDVFYYIENRKIILFGSGRYAKAFLTRYGDSYHVTAAIDNNSDNWNTYIYPEGYEDRKKESEIEGDEIGRGVKVVSPEYLKSLGHDEYKVIICIKNYALVIDQLEQMGVYEYSVFNPGRGYQDPNKTTKIICNEIDVEKNEGKKYHLGYTAGAFDLFHTGHVNLLRRAKEMCDYLIVGVMSDEGIRENKKKEPCIPYEDRAAVVASCRYVDEVVEIPYKHGGSDEAWKLYHFDVQFCGSDYVGDEGRMKEKEFLEAHGATLVIFPYTEHTSSSKIRERLQGK